MILWGGKKRNGEPEMVCELATTHSLLHYSRSTLACEVNYCDKDRGRHTIIMIRRQRAHHQCFLLHEWVGEAWSKGRGNIQVKDRDASCTKRFLRRAFANTHFASYGFQTVDGHALPTARKQAGMHIDCRSHCLLLFFTWGERHTLTSALHFLFAFSTADSHHLLPLLLVELKKLWYILIEGWARNNVLLSTKVTHYHMILQRVNNLFCALIFKLVNTNNILST